jgi:hypothetical protein
MIAVEPARDDFWRVHAPATEPAPFKEWQHFIIVAPGLDLLVNFNLASAGPDAPDTGRVIGRVIVLARTSRWTGFVETAASVEISRDGCHSRFGRHRAEISARSYRIAIAAPDRGVVVDATFWPQVLPIIARRQRLAPHRHLDWTLTARLAVAAHIELPGSVFDLTDALGYHDHNWGHFHWGDDFAWEWGTILPSDGQDWAIVYSNLMNGARTWLALEQLFVWQAGHNVLAAGGLDVRSRMRGRCRAQPELRIPATMALLQPRLGDLPRRFEIAADNGHSEVVLRFTPESIAQVAVPSERALCGTIAINECVGAVAVQGRIAGRSIRWEGRGVFEFVR